MANIKLNLTAAPFTGQLVTFCAPYSCADVTEGLIIKGEIYTVCDAMGACVTGVGGAWCEGATISVALDVENKKAYLQSSTKAIVYTVTFPAADWLGDTAPYTQTVAVEGILATDSPIVDILLTEGNETAELEAWGYIGRIDTAADSITVTCFEDVPAVDLNLQIKVVR